MKADSYFDDVDDCVQIFRHQITEEEKEIQESSEKVISILNSLFKKVLQNQHVNQMKISIPCQSVLDTLYHDEQPCDLFFNFGKESKNKKLLALERKAEYNAFLEKKEEELLSRKKVLKPPVQPKSILESIDYEKVLARRREEEAKFREANMADPQLQESLEVRTIRRSHTSPSLQQIKENIVPSIALDSARSVSTQTSPTALPKHIVEKRPKQETPVTVQRTGGGGEPVKDSLGNLITVRGFSEHNHQSYSSVSNSNSVDKKLSYREELKQQIEEKRRLEAAAREEAFRLEEQRARRAEDQRQQMITEYENELKKNNLIKEQRQTERLKNLEEFQRNEIAQKEKLAKERCKQYSKHPTQPEISSRTTNGRPPSPPVPSVRSKVILERTTSPAVAKAFTEVRPENLFSSLAEIRKSIMKDRNVRKNSNESYEVSSRRTVNDISDDFD